MDAIKHHALVMSVRDRRAEAHILTEYVWAEEGAEAAALEDLGAGAPPWLGKLVARQLADEQRHAGLFRDRLAALGVNRVRPAPAILRAKLVWLDRVCAPYTGAFTAGRVVVLLAVAAQLEATGVRMFARHLDVLEERAPDDPTTAILRTVVADERRHAKSCAAAAHKLMRPEEEPAFDRLRETIAAIDRAFGITLSVGFWIAIAAARLRRPLPSRTESPVTTPIEVAA